MKFTLLKLFLFCWIQAGVWTLPTYDVSIEELDLQLCFESSRSVCSVPCGIGDETVLYQCTDGPFGFAYYQVKSPCVGNDCNRTCAEMDADKTCTRIFVGQCSKTCGVGVMTKMFDCDNINYDCEVQCCCKPCAGNGTHVPTVLCKDIPPIPEADWISVCPP